MSVRLNLWFSLTYILGSKRETSVTGSPSLPQNFLTLVNYLSIISCCKIIIPCSILVYLIQVHSFTVRRKKRSKKTFLEAWIFQSRFIHWSIHIFHPVGLALDRQWTICGIYFHRRTICCIYFHRRTAFKCTWSHGPTRGGEWWLPLIGTCFYLLHSIDCPSDQWLVFYC